MTLKQNAVNIANAFTKWNLWKSGGGSSTEIVLFEGQQNSGTITFSREIDNSIKTIVFITRANADIARWRFLESHYVLVSAYDLSLANNLYMASGAGRICYGSLKTDGFTFGGTDLTIFKIIGLKF